MSNFEHLRIHPERPQIRLIRQAAKKLKDGHFVIVPTETTYAIMVLPKALKAQENIRKLRNLDDSHLWALACSDLAQAAKYVSINNPSYRLLKHYLPGPYTFILPANSQLPKRIFGKRKDVGIRIPAHPVCQMLLEEIDDTLLATSMHFPSDDNIAIDPDDMASKLRHYDAMLLDAGWGGIEPTTVVDLCADLPSLLRQGIGEWDL